MNVQAKLLKVIFDQLRSNPCSIDLGLFETESEKPSLAAGIVEAARTVNLGSFPISPNGDSLAEAAQLLGLTDDEAIRLLRVTYWNEPFASACIFSAFEYLEELAEYKFRFDLTETQEINSRKVLKLFAYKAIVEICVLRIMFFFATDKTDEALNFDAEKIPPASGFVKADQLLMKVDYWRRFPVEKVNNILSFKHQGWL